MVTKPKANPTDPTEADEENKKRFDEALNKAFQKPDSEKLPDLPTGSSESAVVPPSESNMLTSSLPYTLDSQNLIAELSRIDNNAASEIEAINQEITSINERMMRDIETIQNRANAEIEARSNRITDLQKTRNIISSGTNSLTD